MKKYGRQRQHEHGYQNCSLKKGEVMWWEYENHNGKSKKRERQETKKQIISELQTNTIERMEAEK